MIARAAAEAATDGDTFRQKMDVVRQPDASDNPILYSAKVPANRPASDYTPRVIPCKLDLAFRLNSPNPEGHVPAHSEQGQHECAVRVFYISAPDTSERFSGLTAFPWISA